MRFSKTELEHITIALFVITLALTLHFGLPSFMGFIGGFILMLLTFGVAFIAHELAHKFVAQRYGFWAEFRYWETGLILGLMMAFTPILFLAPGAVYISAYGISMRQNAYISLAGAATNVGLALIFSVFAPIFSPDPTSFANSISSYAIRINLLLAMFNLLPFPPLDGSKVFAWDAKKWAIIFVSLLVLRSILV